MFEILVYILDVSHPVRVVTHKIIDHHTRQDGMSRYISFKDVQGREGTIILNPDKVAAVVMTPIDEPG